MICAASFPEVSNDQKDASIPQQMCLSLRCSSVWEENDLDVVKNTSAPHSSEAGERYFNLLRSRTVAGRAGQSAAMRQPEREEMIRAALGKMSEDGRRRCCEGQGELGDAADVRRMEYSVSGLVREWRA